MRCVIKIARYLIAKIRRGVYLFDKVLCAVVYPQKYDVFFVVALFSHVPEKSSQHKAVHCRKQTFDKEIEHQYQS